MNDQEERDFTDYGYNKRYGETYEQADRRHEQERYLYDDFEEEKGKNQRGRDKSDFDTQAFLKAVRKRNKAVLWSGVALLLLSLLLRVFEIQLPDLGGQPFVKVTALLGGGLVALALFARLIAFLALCIGGWIFYSAGYAPSVGFQINAVPVSVYFFVAGIAIVSLLIWNTLGANKK